MISSSEECTALHVPGAMLRTGVAPPWHPIIIDCGPTIRLGLTDATSKDNPEFCAATTAVRNTTRAVTPRTLLVRVTSILRRLLHAVDHEHFKRYFGGFQLQTNLFNSREN